MTPDQLETAINDLRDTALTVLADGRADVVATSQRQYIVVPFEGGHAQAHLVRDFLANRPGIHPASQFGKRADGVVFVAESDDDVLVCFRARKA